MCAMVMGLVLMGVVAGMAVVVWAEGAGGATSQPVVMLGPGESAVGLVFGGGHETVGEDRGRPVVLVASALGVKPEVFREAFKGVHPAGPGSGGPTGAEARANKAALMKVLEPLGVTNERLDEVSNYYRYRRESGEIWKHREAAGYARVKEGKVMGFVITDGGAGYSSVPTVAVTGMEGVKGKVTVSYGKELATNGAVTGVELGE